MKCHICTNQIINFQELYLHMFGNPQLVEIQDVNIGYTTMHTLIYNNLCIDC